MRVSRRRSIVDQDYQERVMHDEGRGTGLATARGSKNARVEAFDSLRMRMRCADEPRLEPSCKTSGSERSELIDVSATLR